MNGFFSVTFYILTFLALYVEVFFLVTFLERRKDIRSKLDNRPDHTYPKVTIIVPAWNEEKTVKATVESILSLEYPRHKLFLILVDDGSTDATYKEFQKFLHLPNVTVLKKENGGKHTAMNLALEHVKTEFVSCLDADSFVTPDALKRMIPHFDDETVMAVAPSIVVKDPRTVIEHAQKAEYQLSVFIKKMLGLVGGIHVTPGPFSVYRMKVFRDLGPYREAHKTEDMEIAYRMQENGYRIEQCHDAIVHTKTPSSAYKLYRQRQRWMYGFVNNTIDYRRLVFKKKYGAFSLFTLPSGIISVISVLYLFGFMVSSAVTFVAQKVLKFQAIGFTWKTDLTFDWFFFSTHAIVFITIVLYGLLLLFLLMGAKMSENKFKFSLGMIYFVLIYRILAPLWLLKAVFNTIIRKQAAWR